MHLKPVILKFILIAIGKTDSPYADEGIKEYEKRLNKYMTFGIKLIPDIRNSRNMPETVQKEKEGEALLEETGANDILILMDERGKEMNSPDFSRFILQKKEYYLPSEDLTDFPKKSTGGRIIKSPFPK